MSTDWKFVIETDAAAFAARIHPFLQENEAENSLLISVAELWAGKEPAEAPPFMATVQRGDKVAVVALGTEKNLILSNGPDDVITLLMYNLHREFMRTQSTPGVWRIPGVIGPLAVVDRFAADWPSLSGSRAELVTNQRLYKATAVRVPRVPGHMRPAEKADLEIVADWLYQYVAEALPDESIDRVQAMHLAAKRVSDGEVFLWVVNAQPVAMACRTRPTERGMAINGVFTPAASRAKGYASAVVAGLTELVLRDGKQYCVLYADLVNSTSNSIYSRLGYKPVQDSKIYRFIYETTPV